MLRLEVPPLSTVPLRQIRARYDRDSMVVYQAYDDRIADAVLSAQRFVAPFSFHRMTWIKPSFLWLMSRSNWGSKSRQERTLAVRMSRAGWDEALGLGVLTAYHPSIHRNYTEWEAAFERAPVHIQWDPERSVRGEHLQHDTPCRMGRFRGWASCPRACRRLLPQPPSRLDARHAPWLFDEGRRG